VIGFRTPRLSGWGQDSYADLLLSLADGLTLTRASSFPRRPASKQSSPGSGNPNLTTPGATSSKYVFATCRCQAGQARKITIRVAIDLWRPEVIQCNVCGTAFTEPLTSSGQRPICPPEDKAH
jgi:hypothetical protein